MSEAIRSGKQWSLGKLVLLIVGLASCGVPEPLKPRFVGVCFPGKTRDPWTTMSQVIEEKLAAEGFAVRFEHAETPEDQRAALLRFVDQGAKALIAVPVAGFLLKGESASSMPPIVAIQGSGGAIVGALSISFDVASTAPEILSELFRDGPPARLAIFSGDPSDPCHVTLDEALMARIGPSIRSGAILLEAKQWIGARGRDEAAESLAFMLGASGSGGEAIDIIAVGEGPALGAVDALSSAVSERAREGSRIFVIGSGPEIEAAHRDGRVAALWAPPWEEAAALAAETALRAIQASPGAIEGGDVSLRLKRIGD